MERKTFYLKKEQIKALDNLSEETGATPSELIRRAIDKYIKEKTIK